MIGLYSSMHVNDLTYALNTLTEKTTQISRNIANADTPMYRAKKLEFSEVMRSYFDEDASYKLYTTNNKHLQTVMEPEPPVAFVRRQNNPSTRTDGNDVNMEYETSELASTNILYNMMIEAVSGKFVKLGKITRR